MVVLEGLHSMERSVDRRMRRAITFCDVLERLITKAESLVWRILRALLIVSFFLIIHGSLESSYDGSSFPQEPMKSVNKVILIGNVTRDAELKATQGGQPVCTFGLATNRVWKDQAGQKQTAAEFHNLVCFGGLAEFVGANVKKGKPLYIEGYLKTRNWEDQSGNKHYRTEIVLENIILLGPRPENGEAPQEHEVAVEEGESSSSV